MTDYLRTPGIHSDIVPSVKIFDSYKLGAVGSHSPEWVVSLGPLLTGGKTGGNFTISGSSNFIILYGFFSGSNRDVFSDVSGTFLTSGSIQHSIVVLVVPLGPHGPKIEMWMYQGKLLETVIIKRLGWTQNEDGEEPKVLQTITFTKARLVGFQMNMCYYVIRLQISEKQNDITVYEQQSGKQKGHNKTSTHYGKSEVKLE